MSATPFSISQAQPSDRSAMGQGPKTARKGTNPIAGPTRNLEE